VPTEVFVPNASLLGANYRTEANNVIVRTSAYLLLDNGTVQSLPQPNIAQELELQKKLQQQERRAALAAAESAAATASAIQLVYREFESFLADPAQQPDAHDAKEKPKHELEDAIVAISNSIIDALPSADPRWAEQNVNASSTCAASSSGSSSSRSNSSGAVEGILTRSVP